MEGRFGGTLGGGVCVDGTLGGAAAGFGTLGGGTAGFSALGGCAAGVTAASKISVSFAMALSFRRRIVQMERLGKDFGGRGRGRPRHAWRCQRRRDGVRRT